MFHRDNKTRERDFLNHQSRLRIKLKIIFWGSKIGKLFFFYLAHFGEGLKRVFCKFLGLKKIILNLKD